MGAPEELRTLLTLTLGRTMNDCNRAHTLGRSVDGADRLMTVLFDNPDLVTKALLQHHNRQALLAEG